MVPSSWADHYLPVFRPSARVGNLLIHPQSQMDLKGFLAALDFSVDMVGAALVDLWNDEITQLTRLVLDTLSEVVEPGYLFGATRDETREITKVTVEGLLSHGTKESSETISSGRSICPLLLLSSANR